jgi:hypothetical protein
MRFKERNVIYCSPIASLADTGVVPKHCSKA